MSLGLVKEPNSSLAYVEGGDGEFLGDDLVFSSDNTATKEDMVQASVVVESNLQQCPQEEEMVRATVAMERKVALVRSVADSEEKCVNATLTVEGNTTEEVEKVNQARFGCKKVGQKEVSMLL
ncbi:hypothetical protein Q3G72_010996 [Acer saccharum]|nr:hypothetical protein Q3G72_010996 [Acer saccharum]